VGTLWSSAATRRSPSTGGAVLAHKAIPEAFVLREGLVREKAARQWAALQSGTLEKIGMARSTKDVPIESGSEATEPAGKPESDPRRDKADRLSSGETANEAATDDKVSGEAEPDEEAIRRLAYEIWETEGRQPGRDEEYWHRARKLLRTRSA
jgi:hypothetical protein